MDPGGRWEHWYTIATDLEIYQTRVVSADGIPIGSPSDLLGTPDQRKLGLLLERLEVSPVE